MVTDGDRIVDVASYSELSSRFPDLLPVTCSGVLLPSLVNCHIHLDLSVFGTIYPAPEDKNMCDWIRALTKNRQQADYTHKEVKAAAEKTVADQYAAGVGLLLNIENVYLGSFDSCPVEIHSLFEMLGPSRATGDAAIDAVRAFPSDRIVTGHAPYSTAPGLLKFIKKRCAEQGEIFSLHLAENPDEALLLVHNDGCFPQFLKERGVWDDTFPIPGIDSRGVVGYLQTLGVMDQKTICVHCVHLTGQELEIIAATNASICLCPASNKFLEVGRAPLEKILEQNILPALGTDSIASNPVLDMWQEMALLREQHPSVASATVLAMATLGGAAAMHRVADYGSLAEGHTARFLHVQGREYEEAGNEKQLLDLLTSLGRPGSVSWL